MKEFRKHLVAGERWDRGFFLLTVLIDFLALALALVCAYVARYHFGIGADLGIEADRPLPDDPWENLMLFIRLLVYFCPAVYFMFKYFRLYDSRRLLGEARRVIDVTLSCFTVWFFFFGYLYLTHQSEVYSRAVIGIFLILSIVYLLLGRLLVTWLRARLRRAGFDERRLLIVGTGPLARCLADFINNTHGHGYIVAGYIRDDKFPEEMQIEHDVIRDFGDIEEEIVKNRATEIFVTNQKYDADRIMEVLGIARPYGLKTRVSSPIFEVVVTRVNFKHDHLLNVPIVDFGTGHLPWWRIIIKNTVDKLASFLTIMLGMPAWLLIGYLIRRDSPGPIFFRQKRIGEKEKPFTLFKFRTMHQDAEKKQQELEHLNVSEGVLFKVENDPRITKVGNVLRKYSLDEFPQMINVLKGEMSLVGPRPLPERDYELYSRPWHYKRHDGKPGLTCFWQVSGRNEIDFDEMCILDIFYLSNRSLFLDYRILFRTVYVVFFAKGVV